MKEFLKRTWEVTIIISKILLPIICSIQFIIIYPTNHELGLIWLLLLTTSTFNYDNK